MLTKKVGDFYINKTRHGYVLFVLLDNSDNLHYAALNYSSANDILEFKKNWCFIKSDKLLCTYKKR